MRTECSPILFDFPPVEGLRVIGAALGYQDLHDHDELQHSNIDTSAGAVEEMARIIRQIRRRSPHVR
ncbi:MAG: hypothetical protein ACREFO_04590 [Acetobacteraceae bacterium]